MTGIEMIAADRRKQQAKWTAEHDDAHVTREIAAAALCYLKHYVERAWTIENELGLNVDARSYQNEECPWEWPSNWDEKDWKPQGLIKDLTRAGAMIAAEIDRLRRKRLRTWVGRRVMINTQSALKGQIGVVTDLVAENCSLGVTLPDGLNVGFFEGELELLEAAEDEQV